MQVDSKRFQGFGTPALSRVTWLELLLPSGPCQATEASFRHVTRALRHVFVGAFGFKKSLSLRVQATLDWTLTKDDANEKPGYPIVEGWPHFGVSG